jgi:hypothetical protein
MKCQHEDAFDDMYPEFAPDPIVVPCQKPHRVHWRVAEDVADEGGYPVKGMREVVNVFACEDHAHLFQPDEFPNPFNPVVLSRTDSF